MKNSSSGSLRFSYLGSSENSPSMSEIPSANGFSYIGLRIGIMFLPTAEGKFKFSTFSVFSKFSSYLPSFS